MKVASRSLRFGFRWASRKTNGITPLKRVEDRAPILARFRLFIGGGVLVIDGVCGRFQIGDGTGGV